MADTLETAFLAARGRRAAYCLLKLENRLTPLEYMGLHSRLVAENHPNAALTGDSDVLRCLMPHRTLQSFIRRYPKQGAWLFRNPETQSGTDLLVCFTGKGNRLGVAITSFLQCVDASRFHVLLLHDRYNTHYRAGLTGGGFREIIRLTAGLVRKNGYGRVIALGSSMGGLPAIRFGLWPGCSRAISIGGAPPNDAARILGRVSPLPGAFTPLCACLAGARRDLLFVHPDAPGRDRDWARFHSQVTGGRVLCVEGARQHGVLGELSRLGNLQAFLNFLLSPAPVSPADMSEPIVFHADGPLIRAAGS